MKWLSRCNIPVLFFVFLVGLTAVSKTAFSIDSPRSQPADASQKQIQSLLSAPLPGKVVPEEAAAFYKPDSLYQYIDGGADVYRHAARAIRACMLAELAQKHWQLLVDNIAKGDYSVYNQPVLPSHEVHGVGTHEAPRGTLSHWVVIKDEKIKNYQAVVPSTWN